MSIIEVKLPEIFNDKEINKVTGRVKYSATTTGTTRPGSGAAISAGKRGKKRPPATAEARANISAAQKKRYEQQGHPRTGVALTEDHRAKLSSAMKGRPKSEEAKTKQRETLRLKREAKLAQQMGFESADELRAATLKSLEKTLYAKPI